jgi:hypothetical protein
MDAGLYFSAGVANPKVLRGRSSVDPLWKILQCPHNLIKTVRAQVP